jgi:hypothetical protein
VTAARPPYPEAAKVAARNACGETKAGASRPTAFALLLAKTRALPRATRTPARSPCDRRLVDVPRAKSAVGRRQHIDSRGTKGGVLVTRDSCSVVTGPVVATFRDDELLETFGLSLGDLRRGDVQQLDQGLRQVRDILRFLNRDIAEQVGMDPCVAV